MEFFIGGPDIDADERGLVVSFRHVGRPVQQCGAKSDAPVTSADNDPPNVQRWLVAFVIRPDGPLVQV